MKDINVIFASLIAGKKKLEESAAQSAVRNRYLNTACCCLAKAKRQESSRKRKEERKQEEYKRKREDKKKKIRNQKPRAACEIVYMQRFRSSFGVPFSLPLGFVSGFIHWRLGLFFSTFSWEPLSEREK